MRTTKKRRTHMMFSSLPDKRHTRARRTAAQFSDKTLKGLSQTQQQYVLSERDVAVQTVSQLDPHQWTGNQRVIHFGPMAQRDPFYYYYPKGWDILYPAHFGFFPYRTKKSRGSSPTVCLVAFGVFFTTGGGAMTYLAYSNMTSGIGFNSTIQPLKVIQSGGRLTMRTTKKRRTHMMFSSLPDKRHTRARRTAAQFSDKTLKGLSQTQQQYVLSERDVAVQTVSQLDPHQWTGNQRVIHFGPMAQRDPFYYYYPKGWDILYPAHFGFFPYRTKKSRGSSPTVCLVAFGVFFTTGGGAMTYLAYSNMTSGIGFNSTIQPLKIAGFILLVSGGFCLLIGLLWWLFTLQLCNEKLRHTQPHHVKRRKIFVQEDEDEDTKQPKNVAESCPFMPPPPMTVLENTHTETSFYKPVSEMKLFPPVIPGAASTLSMAHSHLSPSIHSVTPSRYNVLTSNYSRKVKRVDSASSYDYETCPEYHGSRRSPMQSTFARRGH